MDTMSAHEHLSSAQFYHATSPRNRDSIAKQGLRVDYDEGEGITDPGVYLSPQVSPHTQPYHDVWAVNTHGLTLHPDPYGDEGGGEVYSKHDIEPTRLRLHQRATRD